jgi:putative salt-induced outer membrane protein YdiY
MPSLQLPSGPVSRLMKNLILVGLLLYLPFPALADRLHFADGESITGVLVGIDDGKVTWQSAILGELYIEQRHVQYIESGDHFDLKLTGESFSNCWMYVQGRKQHLHCDEGVRPLSDWKLVVAAGETLIDPLPIMHQRGVISLALEDSTGNSDITKYDINARSEFRLLESRHTLALRYQDESADGEKTRESWLGSYQYDQFITQRWFATGNAFYEQNKFRELDQRTSVGLGMGYQFLETVYFDLVTKGTLNYVKEEFTTGDSNSRPAFLWNLDFAWRIDGAGMELYHRNVLLQSFDKSSDYEINTITGFRYPISGELSSFVQLEYDYDNLPVESAVDKTDRKWSVGVNYAF